jgi:hypothetical protein
MNTRFVQCYVKYEKSSMNTERGQKFVAKITTDISQYDGE